ncbi:MAG TPA: hypothetical protein PKC30_05010 [Saprospiraceae bacterium]|nr:hypothetical protein [Saprospiraceae bacterium]
MNRILCIFLVLLIYVQPYLFGQPDGKDTQSAKQSVEFVSQGNVTIDGRNISYTARAGTLELRDDQNKPVAYFGFTSYMVNDGKDKTRPILFAYNGGPGSSSFWLHMGILGPRRVVVNDPDFTPASPYSVESNPYSILDMADLVMMDPVGTGLSIPAGEKEFKDFWGVDQDIWSISLFIKQFLIQNGRMNSPKFLLGESYGTFRNAGVMENLLRWGVAMNGVIMVSAVFDLRTLIFPPGEDLSYIVHFPTYAATSWYHNKVKDKKENLEEFIDEVRNFTEVEYVPALFKGNRLSANEKQYMASRLASYTGIGDDFWMKANLRVTAGEYFQELMREEGKTVGRLDSRYLGVNQDLLNRTAEYDPQSLAISPAYISGFLDYFYGELGVDRKLHYQTSAGSRSGFRWDWSHTGNQRWNTQAAISTAEDMARAMTRDPNMKVLIMNGYYDLATVFYGVEYTLDHLKMPPEIRENIQMTYYEAGHMMYTHYPSLVQCKEDLKEFILKTMKR